LSLISDLFNTLRTNKKIDRVKKERKLEARTKELVEKYNISEEEAAAKARLENSFDNLTKTIGKIAPPPQKQEQKKLHNKKENKSQDIFDSDLLDFRL
jgi:septation ring formation regulator EzrA